MNNPWAEISTPSSDVAARRIDHEHPLDIFWARDQLGHYLFVYEISTAGVKIGKQLPELVGIQVRISEAGLASSPTRLVLVLNEESNWEIFYSLCTDLVQTTRLSDDAKGAVIILRRLTVWQEFLRNRKGKLLTEERIKGLLGELLLIVKYLQPVFGIGQAVRFWQGPDGLPQDFCVNESAVEVKTQIGTSSSTVRIASAEQLCTQLPELYLFVVTLSKVSEHDPRALTIPRMVDAIRTMLFQSAHQELERFNSLLYGTGYIEAEGYYDFRYIMIKDCFYNVSDNFPRICKDDLRDGVLTVSYKIDLAVCEEFMGCPTWIGESCNDYG